MDKNLFELANIESEFLKENTEENDAQIISLIRDRVVQLLDQNPEILMSYLYRLDVLEKDLKKVLSKESDIPIIEAFTMLIFNRQKERVRIKKLYKQDPIEGWEY